MAARGAGLDRLLCKKTHSGKVGNSFMSRKFNPYDSDWYIAALPLAKNRAANVCPCEECRVNARNTQFLVESNGYFKGQKISYEKCRDDSLALVDYCAESRYSSRHTARHRDSPTVQSDSSSNCTVDANGTRGLIYVIDPNCSGCDVCRNNRDRLQNQVSPFYRLYNSIVD